MGFTMNASLIYQTLDSRFTGHKHFKFRVLITGPTQERYLKFVELRDWCWDTFGRSHERDVLIYLADKDDAFVRKWAWHFVTEGRKEFAIYFAGEEEYTLFKLKWL
jgi:hypothetical protein